MTLNLPIAPDLEAKLRESAATTGKDLTTFVLEAIQDKLAITAAATGSNGNQNAEQWSREWEAWAASHPKQGYIVDDSRESIYAGRGE